MEQYTDKGSNPENEIQLNIADTHPQIGVSPHVIDELGGRVSPDFYDLATAGFSESELKDMLRLRRQYKEGEVNELTPEYKRLQFARWLYKQGKID